MRLESRLVWFVFAAATAVPSFGQWNGMATYNYGMGMGPIALMEGQFMMSRIATENLGKGKKARSSAELAATAAKAAPRFNFTRSPQISREVEENVIAGLTKNDPSKRPIFEKTFANDAMFREFTHLLQHYGLSAGNTVDALAVYSIVTWAVATGGDYGNAKSAHAVRDQMLRFASTNTAFLKMSNADKQKLTEAIAYQVVLDAGMSDIYASRGETAKLQELRKQVREASLRMGPDPAKLKFTDAGFVPVH